LLKWKEGKTQVDACCRGDITLANICSSCHSASPAASPTERRKTRRGSAQYKCRSSWIKDLRTRYVCRAGNPDCRQVHPLQTNVTFAGPRNPLHPSNWHSICLLFYTFTTADQPLMQHTLTTHTRTHLQQQIIRAAETQSGWDSRTVRGDRRVAEGRKPERKLVRTFNVHLFGAFSRNMICKMHIPDYG
jgi:hypothetical protein